MRPFVCACLLVLCSANFASAQAVPNELTLAEALRMAAERNPTLAGARNAVDVARADRLTATRFPNPAFTFDSEGSSVFRSPASDGHDYTLRVDQDTEMPGRRRLRMSSADRGIEVSNALYEDQLRRLEMEVRRAYFQAVLAKADREVSKVALEEIDRVITLNRARFERGEISGAELRRVQVERLRFQDDLFAAELALRNARAAVLALLNLQDLQQPFDPVDGLAATESEFRTVLASMATPPAADLSSVVPAGQALAPLLSRALSVRPDVQAARTEQQRAETETRLQRALRAPLPTLGAGYKHNAGDQRFVFGVTIPLPLFNQNQGAVARAEAEQRMAASRVAGAERQVALEVQQALNAVEINRQRVAYIEREYLTNAREARDVVLASYRLGAANLIDLLDAQRAFRDTSRTYNRALYEQRTSLIELGAALGTSTGVR